MVKFYEMVLLVVLFLSFLVLVFMSGVSAADPDTVVKLPEKPQKY